MSTTPRDRSLRPALPRGSRATGAGGQLGPLGRAIAQIRLRPSRLIGTMVTVAIGVGFACAALVFTATYRADLAHRVAVEYSGADLVVATDGEEVASSLAADLATVPGVESVTPLYETTMPFSGPSAHGYLDLAVVPDAASLRWMAVVSGSWPTGTDQIAVTSGTVTAAHLPIGSSVLLTTPDAGARTVKVVGIVDPSTPTPFSPNSLAFGAPALFPAVGDDSASLLAVKGDGASNRDLAAALTYRLGDRGVARTVADQAAADLRRLTGSADTFSMVLLGFAAVALTVAGLVIANTVTILLTGRRRQIALLRCVGATREQVRAEILTETALIGAVGSALGAVLGVGGGLLAAVLLHLDSAGWRVEAVPILVAVLIGVLLAIGAGAVPIWRSTTVEPVAALRPSGPGDLSPRRRRARPVAGITVEIVGLAVLLIGAAQGTLPLALSGGAISAVGVLMLARVLLPPLLRVLAVPARRWGVSGALAAANARRNPGRSAAASTALIVGVGLIVMLQVAAASVAASTDRALAERYPVDVAVEGADGTDSALPDAVRSGVGTIPGIARSVPIAGLPVDLDPSIGAGADVRLIGVPPDADEVVRGGLEALDPSDAEGGGAPDGALPPIEVPDWLIVSGAVQVGGTLTVTVGGHPHRFIVTTGHLGDSAGSGLTLVTTADALRGMAPNAPVVAVWAALDGGADPVAVTSALNTLIAPYPDVVVDGSAGQRASMRTMLSTLTTVATGLLAVAVVIAIVGLGATLGLSVVERTRESALLRALGLHRRQLRVSLAVEALLLAAVGAVVGIVIGIGYGWAGAAATFRMVNRTLVLAVPWLSVAVVLAVAVAAGVLASVLPARRAARAHPVEALAEE